MKNLSKKIVSAILSLSFFSGIFLPSAKAGKFTKTDFECLKYDSEYFSYRIATANVGNVPSMHINNIEIQDEFNDLDDSKQFEEIKKMVFIDYCKKYRNYNYETIRKNTQKINNIIGFIIEFLNKFGSVVLEDNEEFKQFLNKPRGDQISEIKKYLKKYLITENESITDPINLTSENIIPDLEASINSSKKPHEPQEESFNGKLQLSSSKPKLKISVPINDSLTGQIHDLIKMNLNSNLNQTVNVCIELYKNTNSKFEFTRDNYKLTEGNINCIMCNVDYALKIPRVNNN